MGNCILRIGCALIWLLVLCANAIADDTHNAQRSPIDIREEVKLLNELVEGRKYDQAIVVCTSILDQNIDGNYRARVLDKRADLYRLLHKYDLALADADAAVKLAPEDYSAFRLRSAIFLALDRYQEAISNCTCAIELEPRQWDLFFSRGEAYMRFGHFAEAVGDFTSAIRLNPANAGIHDFRALEALAIGNFELAEQDSAEAVNSDESIAANAGRYYTLGVARYYLGKRPEAEASFQRAAQVQGSNAPERLAMIGSGYAKLFDYPMALTYYDRAIAADPTNVLVLTDRGLARAEAGDFDDAWKDLQKALQLDKPAVSQYSLRAWLEFIDGQYEQSIHDNEQVLRLRPQAGAGYIGEGVAYLIIGKRSKALEVFKTGLQQATSEDDKALLSIWYALAGGTLDESTRAYLMQFSEQQWPNPLVRYYFGNLDEQSVLKLATRRDPASTSQHQYDAYFYIGARLIRSDPVRAHEYLAKAANKTSGQDACVFARKELEHDFLMLQDDRAEKAGPVADQAR